MCRTSKNCKLPPTCSSSLDELEGIAAAAAANAETPVVEPVSDSDIIALLMVGRTGSRIIAILMKANGLFAPLWVSAAIMFLTGVMCHKWMIEPNIIKETRQQSSREVEHDNISDKDVWTWTHPKHWTKRRYGMS